jgi:glycosyltransferase involved in cell wall biosynthesis
MKIAYATTFDASDVHNWSGTPYHMAQGFIKNGDDLEFIGSLRRKLPPLFKMKQTWQKIVTQQRESPRFNVTAAKNYSKQVASLLANSKADVILAPQVNPVAYLQAKQPTVLWTDAVYASLVAFYPAFAYHSAASINQGNEITRSCLTNCRLAIFSSDWAARAAIEFYGIDKHKVAVVAYGANIHSSPSHEEVIHYIQQRTHDKIKLLFLAKSWERKGGDIAIAIAHALQAAGYPVELNIVGFHQPKDIPILPHINYLGFISKKTEEGKLKINSLLASSHFLLLPSRSDACPMVFAEANAFGLPCITTYIGGIATAVQDGINGMTFSLDAPISKYCEYIVSQTHHLDRYKELAHSSYNEYVTRLNWDVATKKVRDLIRQI